MPVVIREDDTELAALLEKIMAERGFSARQYKANFLRRRIAIRLRAREVDSYRAYARVLDSDPKEYDLLLSAMTINLTYFFRDGDAFAALRERVLAPLVQRRSGDAHPGLRVWCAGCATGEEPYSVAIMLSELLGAGRAHWKVELLASDVDEGALAQARSGRYGDFSVRYLPAGLRERYFREEGGEYQLSPEIMGLVRFQRHDLLHNAYPRQMDLILCRNVLIYFMRSQHEELFRRFHAALRSGGCLLLGRVEIPPREARTWFSPLDLHEHLYARV